ncbi:MAG: DUF1624 domain-containing protein [Pseudonocardia sp.]|nr:DUF1624 domain-containing protein [Pseudonocardia sp.]
MIAVHTFPLADENGITPVGLVAGGTSAALFAVLAGVSVAMLTGRQRVVPGTGSAARHGLRLAVRGLAVGTLGMALGQAELGSIDIILTYYGVLFLLAVPLVLLSTRALFVVGALIVVIAPVISFVIRAQLPPTDLIDPSFTALVSDPGGLLTTLFLTGAYPVLPWLAYLCVGIGVGRCSLGQVRTAGRLVVSGAALVVAAAAVSHLALVGLGGLGHIKANPGLPAEELRAALTEGPDGVTPTTTWWWLAVDTAHSSTPLSMARTIGTSLLVLGALLLLDRGLDRARPTRALRMAGAAQAPLAAAGAMTLTFYTLHVVFAGVAGELDPWVLYPIQVSFALLVGVLWQRLVGRGPLEAGVGTLVDAVVTSPSATSAISARKRTATVIVALALTVIGFGLAVAEVASGDSGSPTTSQQEESAEPDNTATDPDPDDQKVESDPPSRPGQLDEVDQPAAPDGQDEQEEADDD